MSHTTCACTCVHHLKSQTTSKAGPSQLSDDLPKASLIPLVHALGTARRPFGVAQLSAPKARVQSLVHASGTGATFSVLPSSPLLCSRYSRNPTVRKARSAIKFMTYNATCITV